MAAAPIELRHYLRRFTMADLEAGLQPVRQIIDGRQVFFVAAVLQFRYRERPRLDDRLGELQWSEWADVRYEREGDEG